MAIRAVQLAGATVIEGESGVARRGIALQGGEALLDAILEVDVDEKQRGADDIDVVAGVLLVVRRAHDLLQGFVAELGRNHHHVARKLDLEAVRDVAMLRPGLRMSSDLASKQPNESRNRQAHMTWQHAIVPREAISPTRLRAGDRGMAPRAKSSVGCGASVQVEDDRTPQPRRHRRA